MLDRTRQMFEYENLPDTIPAYMLELYLQTFGYAAFVQLTEPILTPIHTPKTITFPSGTYVLYGAIGGERDIYFRPRMFIPANPRIRPTIQATILYSTSEVETLPTPHAIIMKNDTQMAGLLPLFSRYAQQLVENDISIRSAQINARAQVGISVSTDRDRESALKYLDDLEAGKLGIIGEASFLEGIDISNISTQSSNTIIQLIELQQYLKASWFNELGLNVNFNMKREYMSEEEIAVNTDILLPLIDDMYQCRVEAVDIINKAFNLNIKVSKSSAWANKEQEDIAALAEASASGGIPLDPVIQSKIEGESNARVENVERSSVGESNQSTESPKQTVQPVVQEESQTIQNQQSGQQSEQQLAEGNIVPDGNAPSGQNQIEINVNINTEGGNVDAVDISEPETQKESEESDN